MAEVPSRALRRLAWTALLTAACARAPAPGPAPGSDDAAPPRHGAEAPPLALAPATARAEAAVAALRERLAARLAAAVASSGPAGAAGACEGEAAALAAAVSAQTGVELGRALARRGDRAPRWARPAVAEAAGRRAADVAPAVFDLGDRVGVLRPIAAAGSCLACHGGPERLAPALVASGGGDGRATGVAEGDVIGFFWAEARK